MLAILSFVFFTALVGVISWFHARKEELDRSEGYYLAGRHLHWFTIAGSLMLTNLSTELLVGLCGAAYLHGSIVMAWEMMAAIGLVLMAVFFMPRYWAGRITTISEYLGQRFDTQTRRMLAGVFLISIVFNFMPFVLYSGALAMSVIFKVPALTGLEHRTTITLMIWAIGIVGGIYAVFGGLKAVAISDTVNGVLFFAGGLLIPVLGLYHVGDGSFMAGVRTILEAQPERVNPIGAADSNVPIGTALTGLILINTFYWSTNQFIVQRVFGAKSLAHAQKGVLGAGILKLLMPIYVIIPGLIAYQIFGPNLPKGDMAYPLLVELLLPKYLVGFFAAVLFGTIISSFNSGLHSASTLFGLDFYKGLFRKNATDREAVRAGKIFGIVLAILAMIVAPMISDAASLFLLMKRINAVFNMPILAVVVMAMFTRSVPAIAAKTSLVFGMLYFIVFGILLVDEQGSLVVGPLRIHWLYITASNFALQCLYMYLVGRLHPNRRPYDIPLPDKSLNWQHLAWGCSGVLGLLVATYAVQYFTARHFIETMGAR